MTRPRRTATVGATSLHLGHAVGTGRYRVFRNTAAVARRDTPWRVVAQAMLVVPGGIVVMLALTLGFALSLGSAGNLDAARSLLTMLLLAGLVACFAGTLSTTLQALYLGHDVRFLITLPVPLRTLFLTKLPDLAIGALPGALFLIAIAAGQLLGRAAALAYVPFAIVATASLLLIGIGLSTIVTALVIRSTPARLTRALLLLVSVVTVLGVGLLWQRLAAWSRRSGAIGRDDFLGGATSVLNYTPVGWASTVLAEASLENYAVAASWLGLLLGTAMLCLAAAGRLYAVTYMRTFERVESSGGVAVTHRAPSWSHPILRLVPMDLLPWVKREWMLIGRDLRRMSAAVWPVSTLGAYLIATLIRDPYADRPADERFWLTYGALAALPWAISAGTVMFATGGEGREIALLRSLPVRARTIVAAKLFAYAGPIAVASLVGVVLVVGQLDGLTHRLVGLVVLTMWASAGCVVVDFAASSIAPNFHAEQIQRATGILGRIVALFAGGLFLMLTALGAAYLPGLDGAVGRAIGSEEAGEDLASAALAFTLAATIPALMLLVARNRWRRLLAGS